MKKRYASVAYGGMDVHRKFSNVTLRDAQGEVVARERLDHLDRPRVEHRPTRCATGNILYILDRAHGLHFPESYGLLRRPWSANSGEFGGGANSNSGEFGEHKDFGGRR